MKISAYSEQTSPDDNDLHVIVRSGTTYKIKLGTMLEYTPTTPGDWGSPAPTGIKEALDVLAAGVAAATIADGDYGDIVVSGSGTNWVLDSSIDFTGKQLNNGTWDNPVIQNGVINDCAINTISSVDVNALVFSINDNTDPTKQLRFAASGISAGTVRTLTAPNASGTIALTSQLGTASDGDYGDITVSGTGATWTIDNNVVTYAKMQDVSATSRVLGRKTAGSGDTEELTFSEVLDFVGSAAQGDILYRNATAWVRLGAGTSGHYLQTQGTGANPQWAAVSAGSSKYRKVFRPRDNEPPTSNFATLDTRNAHPVLDFDTTTQETAIFSDVISAAYGGGDITVTVIAALTSATSGTLGWDVTFERVGTSQDIDSDGFATAQTITAATVPGTSGQLISLNVSITAGATGTDSLAAGEAYRLRVRRDVANDTAAGDAELWAVVVSEN